VAELGPGFCCSMRREGSIVLRVDQSERRWIVRLPDGISLVPSG